MGKTRVGGGHAHGLLAVTILLAALGFTSCGLFEGAVYKRSVFARINGPATMRAGESALFEATLVYSDGSSELLTPSTASGVVWASSNRATAEVEPSGLVRALAPGTTTISATPSVGSTGSGTRTAGTQLLTVVD